MLVAGLLTVFAIFKAGRMLNCLCYFLYISSVFQRRNFFLWEGEHFRLVVCIVLKLFFYNAVLTEPCRVKDETVQYAHKNLSTF